MSSEESNESRVCVSITLGYVKHDINNVFTGDHAGVSKTLLTYHQFPNQPEPIVETEIFIGIHDLNLIQAYIDNGYKLLRKYNDKAFLYRSSLQKASTFVCVFDLFDKWYSDEKYDQIKSMFDNHKSISNEETN